jgi:hypothetical protein
MRERDLNERRAWLMEDRNQRARRGSTARSAWPSVFHYHDAPGPIAEVLRASVPPRTRLRLEGRAILFSQGSLTPQVRESRPT